MNKLIFILAIIITSFQAMAATPARSVSIARTSSHAVNPSAHMFVAQAAIAHSQETQRINSNVQIVSECQNPIVVECFAKSISTGEIEVSGPNVYLEYRKGCWAGVKTVTPREFFSMNVPNSENYPIYVTYQSYGYKFIITGCAQEAGK